MIKRLLSNLCLILIQNILFHLGISVGIHTLKSHKPRKPYKCVVFISQEHSQTKLDLFEANYYNDLP